MRNVLYLNVGAAGERAKQKAVFSRRYQKRFEEQHFRLAVQDIGWADILDESETWQNIKEKHESSEMLVMYYFPETKMSRRLFDECGQNKYLAGLPFFSVMSNKLYKVHEKLSELNTQFIHSPETFLADKNKENNYELFKSLDISTPDTTVVNNFEELAAFLEEHPDIYLKPIAGTMGRGITRLTQYDESKFQLLTKINIHDPLSTTENTEQVSKSFSRTHELREFIEPLIDYISLVQEAVNPPRLTHNNIEMNWDLRFLSIYPDYYNKILTAGVRAAPKQQIVTNLSAGMGQEVGLEELVKQDSIKTEFEFGEQEFYTLRKATLRMMKEANLFEIGADFIYDQEGKWYAIELNGNPGYRTAYSAGMTLGDFSVIATFKKYFDDFEDFIPLLKTTTFQDMFIEDLSSNKWNINNTLTSR